jgi:hypothetical protein
MPDGQKLSPWDDQFRVPGTIGTGSDTHKVPDSLARSEVPFKELYPDFDTFVREYHGRCGRDEVLNRYGYWQNPNAKWDWYSIGGRWTGYFKLKPGVAAQVGRPGVFETPPEKGWGDIARKGDIDFEGMRDEHETKRLAVYDAVHAAVAGTPPYKQWAIVRAECGDDIGQARKTYGEQPRVAAFDAYARSEAGIKTVGFMSSMDEFDMPRDLYAKQARLDAIASYAIVKDGEWHAKGDMGWWGMSSNEKDPMTWAENFNKMLDALPDTTLLTIVDCHI